MFKFVYACISWEDVRWHPWLHFCGFNLCNWFWRTGLVQKGLGLSVSCDWIKGEWGWNGRSCKSVAVNHVWTKCAHAPLHKWTGEGERANICISHAGVWGGCEGGHWSSWSRLEPRRWCWWKGRNYCGAWEGMRRHLLPQCLLEFMIRILTAGDFGRWLSRTEATRFRWNLRCCWMKRGGCWIEGGFGEIVRCQIRRRRVKLPTCMKEKGQWHRRRPLVWGHKCQPTA